MTRIATPTTLEDCDCGDVVRCDVGIVVVGPPLAGALICRLAVAGEGEDEYREVGRHPLMLARRTRVLARLRGREFYGRRETQRSVAERGDEDPCRGGMR